MRKMNIYDINLSTNKQHILNIAAGLLTMGVSCGISFLLSPYIVKTLGAEANGYVTLANQFVGYAGLVTAALNSMGSRFIMMAYYNGEHERVNKFYSSLMYGDLFLALVFTIVGLICSLNIDNLIKISPDLVEDVKRLMLFIFANYVLTVAFSVWGCVCYVSNRIYIQSLSNICSTVLRALTLVLMFAMFKPSVYFVGVASLAAGMLTVCLNFFHKKHLLSTVHAKLADFSWKHIKLLLSSGIWNTVSSMGSTLITGFDLLICNLFIDPLAMGILAIAKTMPGIVDTMNETVANVFIPSLIIDYAKEKKENIVSTIQQSAKMISVICTIPLAFLIVYGRQFYLLWQPTQDCNIIYILSLITVGGRFLFTGIQPLFSIFTVVNKVKQNSIVMLLNGLASATITFLLIKYTTLGVYAVAGVSVICCAVKNMCYVIPYSAKYLNLPWYTFYSMIIPSVVCTVISCALGMLIKQIIPYGGWGSLILSAMIFAIVTFVANCFAVMKKEERKKFMGKIIRNK